MVWSDEDLVSGPLPLWFQIADRLLSDLAEGDFVPGDLLPSETELTTRFRVSRTTARSALDHVENRGLIVRRPGIGSVVCEPPVEETPNVLSTFTDEMGQRGFTPGFATASIQTEPATALVSKALGIEKGIALRRLECVLLADGAPIATNRTWFSPAAVPIDVDIDPAEMLRGSLYEWIARTSGLKVAYGEESLEATIADKTLASHLRAKIGSATLTTRRTAFTAEHDGVEYSIRQYRGDRYRYKVNLHLPMQ